MPQIPIQILESIQKYKEKIASDLVLKKMFLFGSYAKGHYKPDSDIDLCINADGIDNNYLAMSDALNRVLGIDLRIEPVVFSYEEYKQEPSFGLLKEVKKYGIEV
jgi:uncharacterized protein